MEKGPQVHLNPANTFVFDLDFVESLSFHDFFPLGVFTYFYCFCDWLFCDL